MHRRIDFLPPNSYIGLQAAVRELLGARQVPHGNPARPIVNTGVARSKDEGRGLISMQYWRTHVNLTLQAKGWNQAIAKADEEEYVVI
jgi:hypothetical protein